MICCHKISFAASFFCLSFTNILLNQMAWQAAEVAIIYYALEVNKVVVAHFFELHVIAPTQE